MVNRERSASAPALQLMMATGQRVREILCLTDAHYDRQEYLLNWKKTKNGLPHSLPLPEIAIEILDDLVPNDGGYFSLIASTQCATRYIPLRTSCASYTPACHRTIHPSRSSSDMEDACWSGGNLERDAGSPPKSYEEE
jgi:integrase